ncbi:unnamed protein product [Gordionus sp. m RMFG-2023]
MERKIYYIFSLFLFIIKLSQGGKYEKRLLKDLFQDYEPLERPVERENDTLYVILGITLQQIIDVDEKNQILISNVWLDLEWNDVNLKWNESEYGNIKDIRVAASKVWRPDILMYNSADERFDGTFQTNAVLKSDGTINYIPPGIFKSTCKIDIKWFPFDYQKCPLKFGSWTYNGFKIDLKLKNSSADVSTYMQNGEWDMLGIPATKNIKTYDCCPEPYVDITYEVVIRRRTLYYGFALPPDSGEKLTLGVTILLSLTVFLLLVAETMPATSDSVPLIGIYFSCIMVMCSASVLMTVVVLNFHNRSAETFHMPYMVRKFFIDWMAKILKMERPVDKERTTKRKMSQLHKKLREIALREKQSRNMLNNILNFERIDNFSEAKSADDLMSNFVHTPGCMYSPHDYLGHNARVLKNPHIIMNHGKSNEHDIYSMSDMFDDEGNYRVNSKFRELGAYGMSFEDLEDEFDESFSKHTPYLIEKTSQIFLNLLKFKFRNSFKPQPDHLNDSSHKYCCLIRQICRKNSSLRLNPSAPPEDNINDDNIFEDDGLRDTCHRQDKLDKMLYSFLSPKCDFLYQHDTSINNFENTNDIYIDKSRKKVYNTKVHNQFSMANGSKEFATDDLISRNVTRETIFSNKSGSSTNSKLSESSPSTHVGINKGEVINKNVDCKGSVCQCESIKRILKELQMITRKMKKDDKDHEISMDWKFVSMIVDRLCLYAFTIFAVIATFTIIFKGIHFSNSLVGQKIDNIFNLTNLE